MDCWLDMVRLSSKGNEREGKMEKEGIGNV